MGCFCLFVFAIYVFLIVCSGILVIQIFMLFWFYHVLIFGEKDEEEVGRRAGRIGLEGIKELTVMERVAREGGGGLSYARYP